MHICGQLAVWSVGLDKYASIGIVCSQKNENYAAVIGKNCRQKRIIGKNVWTNKNNFVKMSTFLDCLA